jgi:membrane-bound lytic murein transglycosylase A
MDDNPDGAKELRRQNRSYVFFREVKLGEQDEPVGAQGIPLTAGRSIAVDKALHVYGTPFFIEGKLPIETDAPTTSFARLMVAQDTGSAIVGPARADIYLGVGPDAGRIAGRLRHPAHFVMLLPRQLDPLAAGRTMPLPLDRPSAKIARLFPVKAARPTDDKEEKGEDGGKEENPSAAEAGGIPLPAVRPDPGQPAPGTHEHPPT